MAEPPIVATENRLLGQLEGRVTALEDRMDRTDTAISARLTSIEIKLDAVRTTLAQAVGGLRATHLALGLMFAIAGGLAARVWRLLLP